MMMKNEIEEYVSYAKLNDNVNEKMQEKFQRMIGDTERSALEDWAKNSDPSNKENAILVKGLKQSGHSDEGGIARDINGDSSIVIP